MSQPHNENPTGQAPVVVQSARVSLRRALVFHGTAILIGGVFVVPLLYLTVAEQTGFLDPASAAALSYIFHNDPLRMVLLGVVTLAPTLYAFGKELRFSLRRYLIAIGALLLLTIWMLLGASQGSGTEPILVGPLGGGLLGLVIASTLGFGGVKVFDRFVPEWTTASTAPADPPLSRRERYILAAVLLGVTGLATVVFGTQGAAQKYEGLRLGMTTAEVLSVKGRPQALGEPNVVKFPDGRFVSLQDRGVAEDGGVAKQQLSNAQNTGGNSVLPSWQMYPEPMRLAEFERYGFDLSTSASPWLFSTAGGGLLRLRFGANRRLHQIICVGADVSGCGALRGVAVGMSKQAVENLLGKGYGLSAQETYVSRYSGNNLVFYFNSGTLYMLGLQRPYD